MHDPEQPSTFVISPRRPSPRVCAEELKQRLVNIRREMDTAGLDILILSDRKNIDYFTDFRTMSWAYKARPVFVGISAQELVLFGSLTEAKVIGLKPHSFTPVLYDGYLCEAVTTISKWANAASSGKRVRIGVDYGQDMLGRGSLQLIDALKSVSTDGHLSSAADPIWQVRLVKTPFEAEQKRTALDIVNTAFDQTIAQAHIGMPEYELCQRMQAQIFLNGAESADPIAMLFSRNDFAYGRPPSDRQLEEGHYVWTDFRATYGGYPADRNRIARAGPPNDWEVETYSRMRTLTHTLANSVKAGMTCAEVFDNFESLWAEADLGDIYSAVSRIGHGGGLDVTEPPSIAASDQQIIVPGMILHLEPKLERDGAVFQFEEVIYIRDDGIEFLSDLSPETVPIIQ
jgi:Xaa-Pro aminopeptidase